MINLKGFTLIELLIVIAILGIIIAAVIAGIDPVDKINAANDARVQADIGAIGTAQEAYATQHFGAYAATQAALQTAGDLKAILAPPTTNYTYNVGTGGTSAFVWSQMKSRKYGTNYWKWCSVSGVSGTSSSNTCP